MSDVPQPTQHVYDLWVELSRAMVYILLLLAGLAIKKLQEIKDKGVKKTADIAEIDFQHFAWRDARIHDTIANLRDRFNAIRAYFSRFHNGDYYIDNSELLKKTRTHESVREGMAYQNEQFKGMLVSSMHDEIELVLEEGPSFRLVRDMKPSKFKSLCQMGGVKAVARCAVKKNGRMIGFVGLDFDSEKCPEKIEHICDYANRVAELIA